MNDNSRGSFDPNQISDWLWKVIDRAGSRAALEASMRLMPREDIIRFQDEFLEAASQLVDEPFSDYLEEDASEDTFQDIAEWVVSQGKPYYSDLWQNPERIADVDSSKGETFSSLADNVFWDRFNMAVPLEEAS